MFCLQSQSSPVCCQTMAPVKRVDYPIGSVKKSLKRGETLIKWKISNSCHISDIIPGLYHSPTFSFKHDLWRLRLQSKLDSYILYLTTNSHGPYSMEYSFGLYKKTKGSLENVVTGVLEEEEISGFPCTIELLKIEQKTLKWALSGHVIFMCTLKSQISHSIQPEDMDEPKSNKLRKLDTLSANFKQLFLSKESCDTTLHVRDKEYKAHRAILIARSSVFADMFLHDTLEKQTNVITIPDCDPDSFEQFLEFLYVGEIEKLTADSALNLYETSNKYFILELKVFCRINLIQNLTLKNLFDVIIIAEKYEDEKLLCGAQKFFNKNLTEILQTSEWDCFVMDNYFLSKELLIRRASKVVFD